MTSERLNDVSLKDITKVLPLLSVHEQELLLAQLTKLEALKHQEQCKTRFLSFVKHVWPTFIAGRHHAIMANAFERVARGELKRLIINMPPRHAIMTSMKIPTTAGFKTMAELQPGDFVFGPDGQPTEVLGKSEVFKGRELYRVTTDDGASLVVDGEHLWTVRLDRKSGVYRDYTTEHLWQRQNGARLYTNQDGLVRVVPKYKKILTPRLPRLPDTAPVQYECKNLPVDPYLFGVWLGDGAKNNAVITCHDDDAVFLRNEIERRGYQTTDQTTRFTFGVLGLKVKLRDLGVLGSKHIPQQYLEASVEQRKDLLRGLMDTDGGVSKAGQCYFAQSSYPMILQVAGLLRSLGHKAFITETEAKIGDKSYGPTWRVSFYASDVAVLPRKEVRTKKTPRGFGRYIKVEKLDEVGDTQCIRVAREDGLFLAGEGYICTHNTKSEFASYVLPAWFLGRFPHKKIIQSSNTAELAQTFGRKVRNLVDSEPYKEIFPDLTLSADSKAAGRWDTNKQGTYFAIGVGGTMTGRGADLMIIDDPHSEAEAVAAETNPEVYDKVYEWYTSGPRQRLQPGGAIIIVMCMTGDTPVLLGDGTEKPLAEVRPGDVVATFDEGKLTTTKVNNWRSSGVDTIYKIQTQSGRILRANERHPFLVLDNGALEWTRVNQLRAGDLLVSLKDAIAPRGLKQRGGSVAPAKLRTVTTESTLTRRAAGPVSTENGKVRSVQRLGVRSLFTAGDTAQGIIRSVIGLLVRAEQRRKPQERAALRVATASLFSSMQQWLKNVETAAMCVGNPLQSAILAPIGTANCALTTVMTPGVYEDCYATTVTSQSDTAKRQIYSNELQRISDFTTDPIVAITLDGEAEVFDVEIDRTENFIANGVVSHNTRWSQRDLTAQVLKASAQRGGDEWEVIEFPAILPSGKALWPEFWSLDDMLKLKSTLSNSKWMAQYQQQPTSDAAAIIKREWWKQWEDEDPPDCDYILQVWDTAFEANNRADYSACTTWGVFYQANDKGENQANIILLNALKDRMEFPSLKRVVVEQYDAYKPDSLIVEKKASGAPLIYELRAMGIPVQDFTPVRGTANNPNNKMARLNAVSDLFASGIVWAPNTSWAEEVIDEVASFPAGEHDDYCFVAATQVLMADGSCKPISCVSAGEYVATPLGPRKVLASGQTGMCTVGSVVIGGVRITCTAGHPIATRDGWVKACDLNLSNAIISAPTEEDSSWLLNQLGFVLRSWSSKVASTVGTLIRLRSSIGGTLVAVGGSCIGMSGFRTTGQYQKGGTFITGTATMGTTELKTLSVCHAKPMSSFIRKTGSCGTIPRLLARISRLYAHLPPNGIALLRGESGIESTQKRAGGGRKTLNGVPRSLCCRARVLCAGLVSRLLTQNRRIAVRTARVEPTGAVNAQRFSPSLEAALGAELSSVPSKRGKNTVLRSVNSVWQTNSEKREPVYNLTVEGAHCYYAGGVLVHNCDTVIMALLRFRQGGFLRLPSDEPEEQRYFKRRREGYY